MVEKQTNFSREAISKRVKQVLFLKLNNGGKFEEDNFAIKESMRIVDDLEADSLDLLDIFTHLQAEYGIEITDEESELIIKVEDLINTIHLKFE